jgi:predicted RNA methylase
MASTKRIDDDVLEVLKAMECDGSVAKLTCGQLDRDLYQRVDKVLKALGGKWNRKHGGHVFATDAGPILAATWGGTYTNQKQADGFFETPRLLAKDILSRLHVFAGTPRLLEPSAGCGAIAIVAREFGFLVDCIERDAARAASLEASGFPVICADFLTITPEQKYDAVVMNPPFGEHGTQADIDHVLHAWEFLKHGGDLAAIMSSGWTFRENKKSQDFLAFVDLHGEWERNEPGTFKESGTSVNTVTVFLEKP